MTPECDVMYYNFQEATLSVEMTAKEELRMAMEKIKKESEKACDVLAMEVSDITVYLTLCWANYFISQLRGLQLYMLFLQVTDLQTQLSRSEQQAARREDNLRQEISDLQLVQYCILLYMYIIQQ